MAASQDAHPLADERDGGLGKLRRAGERTPISTGWTPYHSGSHWQSRGYGCGHLPVLEPGAIYCLLVVAYDGRGRIRGEDGEL